MPSNPVLKATREFTFGLPLSFTIKGNLAFMTTSVSPNSVLQIMDISNPTDPKGLASYANTGLFYGVGVSGNLLFLTKDSMGVDLLDIADPTKPKLLASAVAAGLPRSVVVKGSTAYVASFNAGLQMISFTDPNASSLQLSKSGNAVNLLLSGQVGHNYQLEYTSNIGTIDPWSLLQTITLTNTPQAVTDSAGIDGSDRFYRLRIVN